MTLLPSLLTAPPATITSTAWVNPSHLLLPTTSRSTGLHLASCQGHPPPMPTLGDNASPGTSQPADLCPSTLPPPRSTPQVEQCLCNFHLKNWGLGSQNPFQGKASDRNVATWDQHPISNDVHHPGSHSEPVPSNISARKLL